MTSGSIVSQLYPLNLKTVNESTQKCDRTKNQDHHHHFVIKSAFFVLSRDLTQKHHSR
jgi:hypothetical protein